jgi:TP901 family phage tail tape measure protein
VTGQSAEAVSDQMTAIWNNFDDGTQSLEYYADAITKLGAATAASTSEISEGLEKFAAIAETVGLSYEMAAASVATIIDNTKQSADVVGNALKTVFARVESLSLGETLGDGVDLTKYSQALKDVGVNVLTADGRLRDMDDILNSLGSKWNDLGRETQVALAQTVGGVRQYNQVMSLMNNWEEVKENIDLASEATGTLSQQQKTWSASYEASMNKLKKAKDDLYEQIINDESLIKLNDIFTQLIKSVSKFIDSMGGIKNIATIVLGMFSSTLFPLITNGFSKLGNTIAVWTGKAEKDIVKM